MYLELDGKRKIYYQKCGSGRPLVMVHGNGESSTIFNESVEKLKERFTVFTLDSPGHGKSYTLSDYHYDILAQDIYDFITKMGLQKPVFYGFSDGGIIGLLLAIGHSDLLDTLIISGANLYPKGLKSSSYYGMKLEYFFKKSPLVKMMLNEPNITEFDLQKITCKTFVLAGSRDVIRREHTEFIARNIKNSTLKIIENETHGSYIVNSGKIADIIMSLVDNC